MTGFRPASFWSALVLSTAMASAAPQTDEGTAQSAPALPEILVVGRIPRCRPLPGDPLDDVDLAPAAIRSQQQVIKLDPVTGSMALLPDDDPITGPGIWQRGGTRLDQYVFRVPTDGTPLCIGAREKRSPGWGQLRQVVDATPYHGKTVRVTMWAAAREAGRVWFWVASGRKPDEDENVSSGRADMAAESGTFEFRGTRRWTPVSLTLGPIRCDQAKLSFGFLLDGRGDLWIYQPEIQVIDELSARDAARACRAVTGKRSPHG